MHQLGSIGIALTGIVGSTAAALLTKPKPVAQPKIPNLNNAALAAAAEDPLRRRQGVGANVLTGPGGGEPLMSVGTRTLLGS